jgi:peptide/nickel transport system ATP-binding protein
MLAVRNLAVSFTQYETGLRQRQLTVITELDLEAEAGEVVAVVGSSGSGKSLLAHALLGILPPNAQLSGEMIFKGQRLDPARIESLRGREIALIPQSVGYLDPLQRVGPQVQRAAQLSGARPARARILQQQAFERYGLKPAVSRLFPFQVSGGMARRVLLSTATVGQAELIVADEPTPGLHPTVVVETLRHLRELADEGKAVILITHDIEAALQIADKVAVFYAGTTVEVAATKDFNDPEGSNLRHPYTRALWQALPQNKFTALPGTQPSPDKLPAGCLFADRCPLVIPECEAGRPALRPVRGGLVRCIRA